jgi:uncharacterized protein YndB with AHSA1/START domain
MKAVRIIFVLLAGLVALFFLIAVFLPGEYTVERELTIQKPVDQVFNLAADYELRETWDPWVEKDSTAIVTVTAAEGLIGSKWAWGGDEIGAGNSVIDKVDSNKAIHSTITFTEPRESQIQIVWTFEEVEGGTRVVWSMTGEANYPVGRYFALFVDGMVGPDLEKGLANLKNVLETMPEPAEEVTEE